MNYYGIGFYLDVIARVQHMPFCEQTERSFEIICDGLGMPFFEEILCLGN